MTITTRPIKAAKGQRHRPSARLAAGCLLALAALANAPAAASGDQAALVEQALSAAPPAIRDTATVSDLEGNVLREGTGAYTCFPAPDGIAGPMCMDEEWLRWMDAWMNGEPFTADRLGISYMLAGDSPDGGASNTDPAATRPTAANDWVVEGPHMMLIVPDEAMLDGLPVTTDTGGPYVMWAGTDYSHVMVPVDERPAQRPIPTQ